MYSRSSFICSFGVTVSAKKSVFGVCRELNGLKKTLKRCANDTFLQQSSRNLIKFSYNERIRKLALDKHTPFHFLKSANTNVEWICFANMIYLSIVNR